MIVKINPADVVSIPSDYNNAKGRACRYEVIGEHTSETTEAFRTPVWRDYRDQDIDTGDADDVSEEDWDVGYDAGVAAAQADSDNLEEYNDELAFHRSADYNEGYREGYSSTYFVDWHQRGYDWAERDVEANRAYDDNPPVACKDDDNQISWREGYANGWRDAKVNRL
jgi:hypothetical protein